jgi:hypothetical protein
VVVKLDAALNNNGAEGMSLQFELDLCYCHRLSTCINYVLQKQTHVVGGVKQPAAYLFYEESELVFDTIDDAKALVMYMKKTLLNKKLNNKMKQDVATRFDGLVIMLQSVAVELAMSIELLKRGNRRSASSASLSHCSLNLFDCCTTSSWPASPWSRSSRPPFISSACGLPN